MGIVFLSLESTPKLTFRALSSIQNTIGVAPQQEEAAEEDVEMAQEGLLPKDVEDAIMETNAT